MVGRVLGQGGFGITYLGWDMNLDVKLAIKEFFPQGFVSRQPGADYIVSFAGTAADEYTYGIERFLEEAKTLARFEDHPNVVSVRDFFRENNTAYMIMSFVEGITLERYLENQRGQILFDRAVEILMPVMDALREVHEVGFMHRDISPDNIVMSKKGRVVLIDFGAAREEMRGVSKSLSVILKKGYAPEEQYRSRGKQGPWTDVYAVGATLYRAITGKVPPEALDRLDQDDLVKPSDYGIEIDPAKETALLKAVAIKAKDRYQSVEEFQKKLLQQPAQKVASQNEPQPDISASDHRYRFKPEPKRGNDLEKEILLSKLEADLGTERSIVIEYNLVCPECNGTGLRNSKTCSHCKFTGKQKKQKTVSVKIPAKVKEGKRVRLKGQGQKGFNGGLDGDLFLKVKIKPPQSEKATPKPSSFEDFFYAFFGGKNQHANQHKEYRWQTTPRWTSRQHLIAALFIGFVILAAAVSSFFQFGGWKENAAESTSTGMAEIGQTPEVANLKDLDADYYIDYEKGTIPIGDLPIGTRVVDPSWEWEFRTGTGYTRDIRDEVKSVTWLVVAKDHYNLEESHVTLLSEELLGFHAFDNSSNRSSEPGSNHWGESGTGNADHGIRPWLNSIGIHKSEGFYQAFSNNFQQVVLTTAVPNREWESGNEYSTNDNVFIPSTSELGDIEHEYTYLIGRTFTYFEDSYNSDRMGALAGENRFYWTRSPSLDYEFCVIKIGNNGKYFFYPNECGGRASFDGALRPGVNIKSETMVSKVEPAEHFAQNDSLANNKIIDGLAVSSQSAQYFINQESGNVSLSELPIGAKIVDPTWEWEFRWGVNYSDYDRSGDLIGPGESKPVTWLVVAKDHYGMAEPHVTLLSEELIALCAFDNSTNRESESGSNHWGDSGTGNADIGLRLWLNSTGIHSDEGFYKAFSESFRQAVVTTVVPNREWDNGDEYRTEDKVFIPSISELGIEKDQIFALSVGEIYPYFMQTGDGDNDAMLNGIRNLYWQRSPAAGRSGPKGVLLLSIVGTNMALVPNTESVGVRPVLNLKSDTLVSEINP